jgi:DSF synthase
MKKDVVMTFEYSSIVPANQNHRRQERSVGTTDGTTSRQPFEFVDLETHFDPELDTLWTYMRQRSRPSFNPGLLAEFDQWQDDIATARSSGTMPIRYLVLGSRFPGVFSLGGDLDLFSAHIRNGDRDALVRYGRACVRILHRNMRSLNQPIITAWSKATRWGAGSRPCCRSTSSLPSAVRISGCPRRISGCFPGWAHIVSCRVGLARRVRNR